MTTNFDLYLKNMSPVSAVTAVTWKPSYKMVKLKHKIVRVQ